MKFVHIADTHFDMPFRVLSDRANLGEIRRLDQRKAFKKMIEYIKQNEIPYLFIAGDLYDHNYIRESTIEYINNLFKEIPQTKIFITPGNHDPYLKNSYYETYKWNTNVRIFKQQIEKVYKEHNREIDNIYLTRFDIERIFLILGKQDKVERIYINFCNPWPRGKHHKKRLTHLRQLEKYKDFLLANGGEIYFKTDDDGLFNDSLIYFKQAGFRIIKQTYNLEEEQDFWQNIETEHEKMFKEQGIKIKALIAKL